MPANISQIGFRAGLTTSALMVAYDLVQIWQILGVVTFPLDEILIYGISLGIVVPFMLTILALHHLTPRETQFWSHATLLLTMMYAVFLTSSPT